MSSIKQETFALLIADGRRRRSARSTTAVASAVVAVIFVVWTAAIIFTGSPLTTTRLFFVTLPFVLPAVSHVAVSEGSKPFTFPLPNGFPFPNETVLEELFTIAGGNFTNMPPAPRFDDDSLTSWKLQAFNEFFEVAFFTQLIANITNRVPGFDLPAGQRDSVLSSLASIQAQEEMHAYNANDAVRYFTPDGLHILPCAYIFPGVSDITSAVKLSQTFTDMYIGLLIDIQRRTAASLGSDSSLIVSALGQALGSDAQQSGWFRSLLQKPASAEPFLTPNTRDLHFSWLLSRFAVRGSCPNAEKIPLHTFPEFELVHLHVSGKTGPITLRAAGKVDAETQRVAFINGALVPTVVEFTVTKASPEGDMTEITASFPFDRNVMHGLTLAVVVEARESFASAVDVSNATLYGPAVIEVA